MDSEWCAHCQPKAVPTIATKPSQPEAQAAPRRVAVSREEDYHIALGMLAATCFIDAHITPRLRSAFKDDYFRCTGIETSEGDSGFSTAAENQWGMSLRIYFPKEMLDYLPQFPLFREATELRGSNTAAINNKAWAYELFSIGFRIGRGHDLSAIREAAGQFAEAFDLGVETAREMQAAVPAIPVAA
jgi:hypothetical protein